MKGQATPAPKAGGIGGWVLVGAVVLLGAVILSIAPPDLTGLEPYKPWALGALGCIMVIKTGWKGLIALTIFLFVVGVVHL